MTALLILALPVWLLIAVPCVTSLAIVLAAHFAESWRNVARERDVFIELHRLASRDLKALMAGAPVHLVNVCRYCNRQLTLDEIKKSPPPPSTVN